MLMARARLLHDWAPNAMIFITLGQIFCGRSYLQLKLKLNSEIKLFFVTNITKRGFNIFETY